MLSQRRKKTKSINTNNIKPQLSKYIWSNKMCTFFSNLVNWFQSIDDLSFLTLEVFKCFFPPYILCYLSELVMLLLTLATTGSKLTKLYGNVSRSCITSWTRGGNSQYLTVKPYAMLLPPKKIWLSLPCTLLETRWKKCLLPFTTEELFRTNKYFHF